jgi:2-octaprenylphenol hydroxylase
MTDNRYDVIIHGAGMVGLVLAAALLRQGMRVVLLDTRPVGRWRSGEPDLRVSAITVASEWILRNVGVWEDIAARRISPFRCIQAWDVAGKGSIRFDCATIGEPHLGHIIENSLIQTMLYERIAADRNLTLIIPNGIVSLWREPSAVTVELEDNRRLSAALLVGADGAQSRVRQLAEINAPRSDYGQIGLVANVAMERSHAEVARQWFLPAGPLALLPLTQGGCSIVWSLPAEEEQYWLQLADGEFSDALTRATSGVLGKVRVCGARAAFPLYRMHAAHYVAERIALVGDAAHVIHPLAGQGANLGLLDAAALAEVVAQACGRGRDIGGNVALRRYERWRRGDNMLMQQTMDVFHVLFRGHSAGMAALRSMGLNLVDRMAPAKGLFMQHAVGLGGDLPKLARMNVG